jgi:hypothetical protein
LKILQTLPLLISGTADVAADTLIQSLEICFILYGSAEGIIHNTAAATISQLITLVFDRAERQTVGVAEMGGMAVDTESKAAAASPESAAAVAAVAAAAGEGGEGGDLGPAALNAYLLFQDLCILSKGERGQWLTNQTIIPRCLGLELIAELVSTHTNLFLRSERFGTLITFHVCPLVVKGLRQQADFPLVVRLLRLVVALSTNFRELIGSQCMFFVNMLLEMLPCDRGQGNVTVTPLWHSSLTLEALLQLCQAPSFLRFLHQLSTDDAAGDAGDAGGAGSVPMMAIASPSLDSGGGGGDGTSRSLLAALARSLRQFIRDFVGQIGDAAQGKGGSGAAVADELDAAARLSMRSGTSPRGGRQSQRRGPRAMKAAQRVMQLLGEDAPPADMTKSGVVMLATECVVSIADCLSLDPHQSEKSGAREAGAAEDAAGTAGRAAGTTGDDGIDGKDGSGSGSDIDASRRAALRTMIQVCWEPLLGSLSMLLEHCTEPLLVQSLLKAYQSLAYTCGVLGGRLLEARDKMLASLCRHALPQVDSAAMSARVVTAAEAQAAMDADLQGGKYSSSSIDLTDPTLLNRCVAAAQREHLGRKHIQSLETLFNVAHCLGGMLGSAWHIVLETFESLSLLIECSNEAAALAPNPSGGGGHLAGDAGSGGHAPYSSSPAVGSGKSALSGGGGAANGASSGGRFGPLSGLGGFMSGGIFGGHTAAATGGAGRNNNKSGSTDRLGDALPGAVEAVAAGDHHSGGSGGGSGGGGGGSEDFQDGVNVALGSGARSQPRVVTTSGQGTVAVDDEIAILSSALGSLFESSRYLDEEAVVHLVSALGALTLNALANAATVASIEREAARAAAADEAMRKVEAASLAIERASSGPKDQFDFGIDEFDISLSPVSRIRPEAGHGAGRPPPAPPPRVPSASDASGAGYRSSLAVAESVHARVRPPFALLKLVETAQHNIFRIHVIWDMISAHLKMVASNRSAHVRAYGVQALIKLVISTLAYRPHAVPGAAPPLSVRLGERDRPPLAAYHALLLRPLTDCFDSPYADTQRNTLEAVYMLLQQCGQELDQKPPQRPQQQALEETGAGRAGQPGQPEQAQNEGEHTMTTGAVAGGVPGGNGTLQGVPGGGGGGGGGNGWKVLLKILLDVAVRASRAPSIAAAPQLGRSASGSVSNIASLTGEERDAELGRIARSLLPLGFRSVQLVVDDFLQTLPIPDEDEVAGEGGSMGEGGAGGVGGVGGSNAVDDNDDCLVLVIRCLGGYAWESSKAVTSGEGDVNLSLTAIGMLWHVADLIKQQLSTEEESDAGEKAAGAREMKSGLVPGLSTAAPGERPDMMRNSSGLSALGGGGGGRDGSEANTPLRAAASAARRANPVRRANQVWRALFAELCHLGCSDLPEVRNCALRTLFSTVAAHGNDFTPATWQGLLSVRQRSGSMDVLAGVAASVMGAATGAVGAGAGAAGVGAGGAVKVASPYSLVALLDDVYRCADEAAKVVGTVSGAQLGGGKQMVVHHSRDTAEKQWNETRVAALRGMVRILRTCFGRSILRQTEWFHIASLHVLNVVGQSIATDKKQTPGAGKSEGGVASPPARRWTARDRPEVALAAVGALQEILLVGADVEGSARDRGTKVKTGTTMRVVDGALTLGGGKGGGGKVDGAGGGSSVAAEDSSETELRRMLWDGAFGVMEMAALQEHVLWDPEEDILKALAVSLGTIHASLYVQEEGAAGGGSGSRSGGKSGKRGRENMVGDNKTGRVLSQTHMLMAPGQSRRFIVLLHSMLVSRPTRDEISKKQKTQGGVVRGLYKRTLSPVEREIMLLLPQMAPLPPADWPVVFEQLLGYATSPRSTSAFALQAVNVLEDLYRIGVSAGGSGDVQAGGGMGGDSGAVETASARASVLEPVVNALAGIVRARCLDDAAGGGAGEGAGDEGSGGGDGGGGGGGRGGGGGSGGGDYATEVEREVAQEVWHGAVQALLTVVELGLPALAQCQWSQERVEATWVLVLRTMCEFFVLPQRIVAAEDDDGGGAAEVEAEESALPVDIALLSRVMDQAVPLLRAGLVPREVQSAVLVLLDDGAGNSTGGAGVVGVAGTGGAIGVEGAAGSVSSVGGRTPETPESRRGLVRRRHFRHACLEHLFALSQPSDPPSLSGGAAAAAAAAAAAEGNGEVGGRESGAGVVGGAGGSESVGGGNVGGAAGAAGAVGRQGGGQGGDVSEAVGRAEATLRNHCFNLLGRFVALTCRGDCDGSGEGGGEGSSADYDDATADARYIFTKLIQHGKDGRKVGGGRSGDDPLYQALLPVLLDSVAYRPESYKSGGGGGGEGSGRGGGSLHVLLRDVLKTALL